MSLQPACVQVLSVPELLDTCIEFLWDDPIALRSCSFVRKSWSIRATQHLFRRLTLDTRALSLLMEETAVLRALRSRPRICNTARTLVLNTMPLFPSSINTILAEGLSLSLLQDIVSMFPCLQELSMEYMPILTLGCAEDRAPLQRLRQLTRLTLDVSRNTFTRVSPSQFLSLFSRVGTLTLVNAPGADLRTELGQQYGIMDHCVDVEELSLQISRPRMVGIATLINPKTLRNLQLDMAWSNSDVATSLNAFLSTHAQSLERFSFMNHIEESVMHGRTKYTDKCRGSMLFALNHCSQLRSIHVSVLIKGIQDHSQQAHRWRNAYFWEPIMASLLSLPRPSSLTSLVITMSFFYPIVLLPHPTPTEAEVLGMLRALDWGLLDQVRVAHSMLYRIEIEFVTLPENRLGEKALEAVRRIMPAGLASVVRFSTGMAA